MARKQYNPEAPVVVKPVITMGVYTPAELRNKCGIRFKKFRHSEVEVREILDKVNDAGLYCGVQTLKIEGVISSVGLIEISKNPLNAYRVEYSHGVVEELVTS